MWVNKRGTICIFASKHELERCVFNRTIDSPHFSAGGDAKSLNRTPVLPQWYKANYWILYGKQGTNWPRSGKGRSSGRRYCAGAYLRDQRLCYQPLASAARCCRHRRRRRLPPPTMSFVALMVARALDSLALRSTMQRDCTTRERLLLRARPSIRCTMHEDATYVYATRVSLQSFVNIQWTSIPRS